MSDENLVAFPGVERPIDPDAPLQVVRPERGREPCKHPQTRIDPERRRLYCADPKCDAALDPFDFLLRTAEADEENNRNYNRLLELRAEMVVHARGPERWTLCGSDSDKREWRVTVTNLVRDVTCQRCKAALTKAGKGFAFWGDERIAADGSRVRARDLREAAREVYHPACGFSHRKSVECPSSEVEKPETRSRQKPRRKLADLLPPSLKADSPAGRRS